jgi:hypothetical protein
MDLLSGLMAHKDWARGIRFTFMACQRERRRARTRRSGCASQYQLTPRPQPNALGVKTRDRRGSTHAPGCESRSAGGSHTAGPQAAPAAPALSQHQHRDRSFAFPGRGCPLIHSHPSRSGSRPDRPGSLRFQRRIRAVPGGCLSLRSGGGTTAQRKEQSAATRRHRRRVHRDVTSDGARWRRFPRPRRWRACRGRSPRHRGRLLAGPAG